MNDKTEMNVTREGTTVRVKRSFVNGVKADLVKREITLTLKITLDESSLAVRDDMAFWAFDETPVALVLKPARTQLGLPMMGDDTSMTLSGDGKSVTMSGKQFSRAVNELTGEIEGDDEDA